MVFEFCRLRVLGFFKRLQIVARLRTHETSELEVNTSHSIIQKTSKTHQQTQTKTTKNQRKAGCRCSTSPKKPGELLRDKPLKLGSPLLARYAPRVKGFVEGITIPEDEYLDFISIISYPPEMGALGASAQPCDFLKQKNKQENTAMFS